MKKIFTLLLLFVCLYTAHIFAQTKANMSTFAGAALGSQVQTAQTTIKTNPGSNEKNPDTLINLSSVVTAIHIVKLNESQSSYAVDFNKDAKSGSTKNSLVAYPNTIIHFTISNPMTFLKTRPNDRAKVVFY